MNKYFDEILASTHNSLRDDLAYSFYTQQFSPFWKTLAKGPSELMLTREQWQAEQDRLRAIGPVHRPNWSGHFKPLPGHWTKKGVWIHGRKRRHQ